MVNTWRIVYLRKPVLFDFTACSELRRSEYIRLSLIIVL
jgi:hypothetical protein